MKHYIYKAIPVSTGGIGALFLSIESLLWVCFLFIVVDALSAYDLNKRVVREVKRLGKVVPKNEGKFRSSKAFKMIITMRDIAILIVLAHVLDTEVLGFHNGLYLANYVTGIFCVLQAWSILENASSCNGATWARVLQKIMVDKTSRHFDIDITELKNELRPQ